MQFIHFIFIESILCTSSKGSLWKIQGFAYPAGRMFNKRNKKGISATSVQDQVRFKVNKRKFP